MFERIPASDREAWLALRGQDLITGSVAGALFGVHEYKTMFQLWAEKTGRVQVDNEEQKQMIRGRKAEGVSVDILREEHPTWTITHNEGGGRVYLRDTEARIGATPDIFVYDPERGRGGIQVKSVEQGIFRRKWIDASTREVTPPLWICIQSLLEAHLAGWEWVDVAPIVFGFGIEMPLIQIPLKPALIEALYEKTAEFGRIIDAGEEMAPDFGQDSETISRMYEADDGSEADLPPEASTLVEYHAVLKAGIAERTAEIEKVNAQVKMMLGNHSVGHLSDGRKVSWKSQTRKEHIVRESTFRVLRYPKE